MGFLPPFLHDGSDEVQAAAAGTIHCVSQTRSVSVSSAAGAAVVRFEIFIVTRRHAVFFGWHESRLGQLTFDDRVSRVGMFLRIAAPSGDGPATTPVPPIWRTYIACVPSSALIRLVESA